MAIQNSAILGRSVKYKKLQDKAWLYREYIVNQRLQGDLAEEVGCTRERVRQSLIEAKIEPHKPELQRNIMRRRVLKQRSPLLSDEQWLKKKYVEQKRSINVIAQEIGATNHIVKLAIQNVGIKIRSHGEAHRASQQIRKNHIPQLFDKKWLHKHYVDQEMSMSAIGDLLGIRTKNPAARVLRAIQRVGIRTRRRGPKKK